MASNKSKKKGNGAAPQVGERGLFGNSSRASVKAVFRFFHAAGEAG
jgi:hypothetical protein